MSKKKISRKKRKKKLPKSKTGSRLKILAITLGDPRGIGPEIIHKSLQYYKPKCAVIVIGSSRYFPDKKIKNIRRPEDVRDEGIYFYDIGQKTDTDISFEYVKTGAEFALKKKVNALITAPISKEKWLKAGIKYSGHTEYLAKTAGVRNHSMFFWSENLKVSLFTIHVPLKKIFRVIKKREIVRFIYSLDRELLRLFNKKFTILVSGLNPHAGEEGFLGREEIDEIIPAIDAIKLAGEGKPGNNIRIEGPYSPDTVFLKAGEIKDSVVIAWYHDQGLIPFKLLNFHGGVNLTLGLPYVRTSPDHGTAFDIAGKNISDPASMTAAVKLAEKLV